PGKLVVGANIAGFVKVADAMLEQCVLKRSACMKMMSITTKKYLKRTTNHGRAKGAAAISVFLIAATLGCAGQFNASTSTGQTRVNSPPAFLSATNLSLGATDRGSAAGLDGRWYHDGAPTRILVAPDGRSITIVNEFGKSSDG